MTESAHSTHIETAVQNALATVARNLSAFADRYPNDTTVANRYQNRPALGAIASGGNHGWTTSFYAGMLWVAWQLSGEQDFREGAERYTADFARRVRAGEDLETHDLGFLYTLSSVAAWRLTGDDDARAAALEAAEHLMRRFLEPAGIVQAWGDLADPKQSGRTIIDSLMNMPLLTWAYQQTGDARFIDAVRRHSTQLRQHIIRPDDSTFHTFYWDVGTGEPLRGATEQGAFDDSCWARGQAWGIYGFAMNGRALDDPELLEASRRCANYFLAHLPADRVPYWDLVYPEGSDAPRDSSAASIAVCGLLELAETVSNQAERDRFVAAAHGILSSLIENYSPQPPDSADALILHGVYHLPEHVGVDEGNLWGDYFYLEALARVNDPSWRPAW